MRASRARTGLTSYEGEPPPPSAATDGQSYWFGGIAFGRTLNVAHGPDTKRLRDAADAMTAYCFDAGPSTRAALSSAVAALEGSEPG